MRTSTILHTRLCTVLLRAWPPSYSAKHTTDRPSKRLQVKTASACSFEAPLEKDTRIRTTHTAARSTASSGLASRGLTGSSPG
eukprot:1842079-Pyramimonas_sp.AAC.1